MKISRMVRTTYKDERGVIEVEEENERVGVYVFSLDSKLLADMSLTKEQWQQVSSVLKLEGVVQ